MCSKMYADDANLSEDGWLLQLEPAAGRRHDQAVLAVGAGARQVADAAHHVAPQVTQ